MTEYECIYLLESMVNHTPQTIVPLGYIPPNRIVEKSIIDVVEGFNDTIDNSIFIFNLDNIPDSWFAYGYTTDILFPHIFSSCGNECGLTTQGHQAFTIFDGANEDATQGLCKVSVVYSIHAAATHYSIVSNFLNNLPDCDWCVACGSYAQYTRENAELADIPMWKYRITTPPDGNMVGGHQLNYFRADENGNPVESGGEIVYVDNMQNSRDIFPANSLRNYIYMRYLMTF